MGFWISVLHVGCDHRGERLVASRKPLACRADRERHHLMRSQKRGGRKHYPGFRMPHEEKPRRSGAVRRPSIGLDGYCPTGLFGRAKAFGFVARPYVFDWPQRIMSIPKIWG